MWLWRLLALVGLVLLVLLIAWVTTGAIKRNNTHENAPAVPGAG